MRRARILIVVLVTALAGWAGVWFGNPLEPVDHAAWERDSDQLLADLGAGYANLDWLAATGRVDPPRLASQARRQIQDAWTNRQARRAIERFIDAFGDPHLRIEGRTRNWVPRFLRPGRLTFSIRDLETLPKGAFEAAVLPLGGGKTAGVIRIPSFDQRQYVTEAEVRDDREAMKHVVAKLDARITEVAARRVGVLLIDIRGNGGGTDWADPAARLLTEKPLRYGGGGRVRSEAWVKELEAERAALAGDLQSSTITVAQRQILDKSLETLDGIAKIAKTECARNAVWTTGGAPCFSLVRTPGGGLAGYAPPDLLNGLASARHLFSNSDLRLREGAWTGPLAILMDSATGSAAEQFAALLKDNGAATLLGQRTAGAGCGYVNGGKPSVLPHSGMRVLMPNCSRFRASGENEIAGIAPDVVIRNEGELRSALRAIAK